MKKSIMNKLINKEYFLYIIFGILATILNIVLFYIFVTKMKISTSLAQSLMR